MAPELTIPAQRYRPPAAVEAELRKAEEVPGIRLWLMWRESGKARRDPEGGTAWLTRV
jgi:hypothetical protein